MFKRAVSDLLIGILMGVMLTGCGSLSKDQASKEPSAKGGAEPQERSEGGDAEETDPGIHCSQPECGYDRVGGEIQ